jgi:FMN phosphatase YigB (HAD superfamily)
MHPEGSTNYKDLQNRFSEELLSTLIQTDVISVDIFDTLLLRTVAQPTDIFTFLESTHDKNGFKIERIRAEDIARRAASEKGISEVDLSDIYAHIPENLKDCWELEVDLELKNIVPNPEIVKLLHWVKKLGKTIVLVSDMYLPLSVINLLLSKNSVDFHDRLILSSDTKTSKADGTSYLLLKEIFGEKTRILHIGDSEWSDVQMARENGLDSYYYMRPLDRIFQEFGIPREFQQLILNDPSISMSRFMSALVLKRIDDAWIRITKEYAIGLWFLAPLSLALLSWIESHEKVRHSERIFFLSRDFSGIYDISKHLHEKGIFKPKPIYVNASRRAWVYPLDTTLIVEELFRDSDEINIHEFIQQLSLDVNEFSNISKKLLENGIKTISRGRMQEFLREYPEILGSFERESSNLKGYLKRLGLLSNDCPVICDLGWSGTQIKSVNDLRRAMKLPEANALFLAHFKGVLTVETTDGFLVTDSSPHDAYVLIRNYIDLFEIAFSGQEPQVIFYKSLPSGIIPKFIGNTEIDLKRFELQRVMQEHSDNVVSNFLELHTSHSLSFIITDLNQYVSDVIEIFEKLFPKFIQTIPVKSSAFPVTDMNTILTVQESAIKKSKSRIKSKYISYAVFLLQNRKYDLLFTKSANYLIFRIKKMITDFK